MDNRNKIIVITTDNNQKSDLLAALSSYSEGLRIANTFSTDMNLIDSPIKEWKTYMSNDDLYLSYKNNALLCIQMDDNQVSEGVTKEEAIVSNVIPMTFKMFLNTAPRTIKGISICWLDSTSHNRTREEVKDANEFMQSTKNYPILYFTDTDDIIYVASTIYRYLKGTEVEREKILKECN